MKKHLLILSLLWPSLTIAQKVRFSETTNKWIYVHADCSTHKDWIYNDFEYTGDTTINNINYGILRIFISSQKGYILVREDTAAGKVYVKYPEIYDLASTDSLEHVLFDYNLNIGDTISFDLYSMSSGAVAIRSVLQSIDSTLIQGEWHRKQHFIQYCNKSNSQFGPQHVSITEGIGSEYKYGNPIALIFAWPNECPWSLLCFHHKGQKLYVNNIFGNYGSCDLKVSETNSSQNKLILAPNPFTSYSKLIISQTIQRGRIEIYNVVGQCVFNKTINQQKEISLQTFNPLPGIYRVVAYDDLRQRTTETRMVAD